MIFVPTSPGNYDLDCVTWRPQGTLGDQLSGKRGTHKRILSHTAESVGDAKSFEARGRQPPSVSVWGGALFFVLVLAQGLRVNKL